MSSKMSSNESKLERQIEAAAQKGVVEKFKV